MTPREQAEQFIAALAGDKDAPMTFQTFSDTGESAVPPTILHGRLSEHWERLLDLQEHGHGVFLMVNEGDGKGRAGSNVTALRALFADNDGDPLPIMATTPGKTRIALAPSLLVSSGGGEHYYWLLQPGEQLADFTPAQKAIAARLRTDPKVVDLPRVLRLPGTLHLKDRSKPRAVELVWCKPERRYTIKQVLDALGATPSAQTERPAVLTSAGPRVLSSYSRERAQAYVATMHATEGDGGDAATLKVAFKLQQGFGLDRAEGWALFREWNQTNAHPPWSDRELSKKWSNAVKYNDGRGPVPERVADACSGLDGSADDPTIKAVASGNPQLDPANWACDLSQSKAWRFWRAGAWQEGISEKALDRLLENEGDLKTRAVNAWKKKVPVVDRCEPVYESWDRIALVDGAKVGNTFRRPTLLPAYAGPLMSPVVDVLNNLVGHDAHALVWLTGWLAKLVQNAYAGTPRRIGTAPVFFGEKGAGKGVLEQLVCALLGSQNVSCISQGDLDGPHNAWLDGKLCVCADEVFTSESRGAARIAKLKNMITAHERLINPKGQNQVNRRAVENWLFFSNSHRPVEVERGDRRFTLLKTGGPIDPALGARVADDARAGGPMVRGFLEHLLRLPASELVEDYRPLRTAAKDEVARASGNSATKFAQEVRERGLFSLTGSCGFGLRELYVELQPPTMTRRRLMDVYRSYAAEINAPAQQETTVLAALREEGLQLAEGERLVDGRRERVLSGLPGMLPESQSPAVKPNPQRVLAV